MKTACKLFLVLATLAAALMSAPASAAIQYYVDPVNGNNTTGNGSPSAPWQTVAHAVGRIALLPSASQAGLVLNLRANALYPPVTFPASLHGTPAQPMVIQPYDGNRVVFDAGEPRFRQPGAWEPVPDQRDEWRTRDPFTTQPKERVAYGQMMDTKLRLINYAAIEDLRATNESYARVALSDPREAFGPLVGDETHKIPFTYLGPGVYYAFENAAKTSGRIHLRLSSTLLNAVGIRDYVGGGDPNTMALSIARASAQAGLIGAQNVIFRNLVFQNGGEQTLVVSQSARDVTFDHCEVYGARYGVRISALASGLKFHHCLFDGGLAPWTSRSDVKNAYHYHGASGCPIDPTNGQCLNNGGTHTHDSLIIHQASQSEYVHCTFRRGHDALQGLRGDNIEIRDSLFEDLNDEVLQFDSPATNVRIHGNVFRQALDVVSFALKPTGGPIYFYRNVVDQRVPTRGYRRLPPDAPAPWIWRYGADFKDVATLEFHAYQNTFISSHDVDKGSYVSLIFATDPTVARTYRNNLHLVLNLDRTLSRIPASTSPAAADGDIWYRYHADPDPLFQKPLFTSDLGTYFTFEELWADFPTWERHSQYADPQLANFTDEYFEYASFYPNTDFRPTAGGPAGGRGVALPDDLPDDVAPGTGAPDVGARPAGAPVLAVGIDAATLFPAPGVPVALAGPHLEIVDANGDGFERVTVDGSGSQDPDGTIATYAWSIKSRSVAKVAAPTLTLPEGEHYLRLVVTDNTGKSDSDAVRVRVVPAVPGENRLRCAGFDEGLCGWQGGGGLTQTPAEVHSGVRALKMTQNGLTQRMWQRVPVSPDALYTVSGWLKTQSLVTPRATLTANVLAAGGAVMQSVVVAEQLGTVPYAYHQATLRTPTTAAFIEVAGTLAGTGSGQAFFDDLRIRDRNLLQNGRFEVRSPSGSEAEAPGWTFARGGLIVDDPGHVRSGRYALALAPYDNYHLITQKIAHTSPSGYRVSGWVKTSGLSTAPRYEVRFTTAAGQTLRTTLIAARTSEGAYAYVSRELRATDIPAATALLTVELRLAQVPTGTAYFEDLLVEAMP